ncbi:MAG TPA: hypothetical protein VNH20_09665 [Candidatus Dormibacteraeota bacterium]|nr:hypothetical protein [Candidatus Dormibacteraeota bacterium]
MTGSAENGNPPEPPPRSFQGWQRVACLVSVGLLLLFMILLVVGAALGVVGVH